MNSDNCCLNCTFWFEKKMILITETQTLFFCRRYPPHPEHGFPETAEDDWCGEWREWSKPKDEE